MADSNNTKLAFSNALKELLKERPFEKISVSNICEKCHRNRKSFYYHFQDKHDLVNWIFDTEFLQLSQAHSLDTGLFSCGFDECWHTMEVICHYFYQNRAFYRRVFQVNGQNSFVSHFQSVIRPLLQLRMETLLGPEDVPPIVYDFAVDSATCAIARWLLTNDCISAEEFLISLKKLVDILFRGLELRVSSDPKWLA